VSDLQQQLEAAEANRQTWRESYESMRAKYRAVAAENACLQAENRDTQLALAALISDLGGQVTIPDRALVDAPRTISVERGPDRSITIRVG
jgi:hypothetical protein